MGYIYVEVQPYGFDEDVFVIIQPYQQFYDYVVGYEQSLITEIYKATFGSKFYIPFEYEM